MLGPCALAIDAPPSRAAAPLPGDGALEWPPHAAQAHTSNAALTPRSYQ
jgi:hypothetical protein